ncbi:serine hydroxymethyltransferase [Brachybacterium nesterenkovii]|uniref:Serine hydroxymethyltransferase n=1 Tax=Brachybacterium nesterenkovii TaxID=47847 RepID=A0A1X6X6L1_9MICO|nr:serine hydroxymethyltransferase [Brachybacterium nesterenkovii]SLM94779.1 Serine hydroxymethyltransferase [Brachybacterium nesterenkovii]
MSNPSSPETRSPSTPPTAAAADPALSAPLAELDSEISRLIDAELARQRGGLEMIASENHTFRAVMEAQGSVLTNKYAEGYPGRRYYGGCEHVDEIERLAIARETQPRLIIAGWSAYPRQLDFARFRAIADEVGALLMVDMAHIAGLVATGLHPSPLPHAHVVTTTTHKTLGGPRGGMILTNDAEIAKKINSAVFPGQQGGPLEHVIAGKAVAFGQAASDAFADRQRRTLEGAAILAERLSRPDLAERGITVLTGGTDVHLVLVDLRDSVLDGQQGEDLLARIDITVNRNAVPFDPRPPMVTSGLRIGTPALATRGFDADAFTEVADIIAEALIAGTAEGGADEAVLAELGRRVSALADAHPLYPHLAQQEA